MRFLTLFLALSAFCILLVLGTSCSTDSAPPDQPTLCSGNCDLSGIAVNRFVRFEGTLYAATDSGLYRSPISDTLAWSSLGLQKKKVKDVAFLAGNRLLAAVGIADFSSGIPSLFLSADNGRRWQAYMNNYGGETGKYTWVEALAAASKPSDTLFAHAAERTIVRSTDGGKNWNVVIGRWSNFGGASKSLFSDPFQTGRIWASGANPFEQPYLLKSTDYGTSWKNLSNIGTTAQVCYDMVSHPRNENLIIAGMDGNFNPSLQIRKSTDGGQSWQTVLEGFGIRTLAHSKQNADWIYASGRNKDGTLFVLLSTDFGNAWEEITIRETPGGIVVNDIVSALVDGQEVLYFGTNKGVFRYEFEE